MTLDYGQTQTRSFVNQVHFAKREGTLLNRPVATCDQYPVRIMNEQHQFRHDSRLLLECALSAKKPLRQSATCVLAVRSKIVPCPWNITTFEVLLEGTGNYALRYRNDSFINLKMIDRIHVFPIASRADSSILRSVNAQKLTRMREGYKSPFK